MIGISWEYRRVLHRCSMMIYTWTFNGIFFRRTLVGYVLTALTLTSKCTAYPTSGPWRTTCLFTQGYLFAANWQERMYMKLTKQGNIRTPCLCGKNSSRSTKYFTRKRSPLHWRILRQENGATVSRQCNTSQEANVQHQSTRVELTMDRDIPPGNKYRMMHILSIQALRKFSQRTNHYDSHCCWWWIAVSLLSN